MFRSNRVNGVNVCVSCEGLKTCHLSVFALCELEVDTRPSGQIYITLCLSSTSGVLHQRIRKLLIQVKEVEDEPMELPPHSSGNT